MSSSLGVRFSLRKAKFEALLINAAKPSKDRRWCERKCSSFSKRSMVFRAESDVHDSNCWVSKNWIKLVVVTARSATDEVSLSPLDDTGTDHSKKSSIRSLRIPTLNVWNNDTVSAKVNLFVGSALRGKSEILALMKRGCVGGNKSRLSVEPQLSAVSLVPVRVHSKRRFLGLGMQDSAVDTGELG